MLRRGPAPGARDRQVLGLLNRWVRRDAPLIDADDDGFYDEAAPAIIDAVWRPIAEAVMRPRFGDLVGRLSLGRLDGQSYVDKDLRTLLGYRVRSRFHRSYCCNGLLTQCRDSLWEAITEGADRAAAKQGEPDPALWRKRGARTSFVPGLLPNTFTSTNRPTFQQVLELVRDRGHGHGHGHGKGQSHGGWHRRR